MVCPSVRGDNARALARRDILSSKSAYLCPMGKSRIWDKGSGPQSPGKPQVAICVCFLRNTGTDPLEKQYDPSGPIASRGRSIPPSVKYVDFFKRKVFSPPHPQTEFSGSWHVPNITFFYEYTYVQRLNNIYS